MSNDKLTQLEHRLALAEREVEKTRAQVRALLEQERPRSRPRRDRILGLLGLVLVFAVTRALDTQAQVAGTQGLKVKAPFEVVDATGKKVILSVAEFSNGALLTFGNQASGGITLGIGPSGGGFVQVRTAAGKSAVALGQYTGVGMGVHVFAPDGQTIEGSLSLTPTNKGSLEVGDPRSGGSHIGVGQSGAGYVIVRLADGKRGIALGQLLGRPMSVGVFGENDKELVSLRTDPKGGSVQVMNPTGVGVGGLLASETGGRVALTGPAGGKNGVSLSVEATGGKVRVFPQGGGSAQAELTAEPSGGAFTVYTSSGQPVALLQATSSGAGRLEISRAGQIYVEAGVLPSGVGVVRAGPQIGGPPVGLGIPDAIMGKSGHK